MGTLTRKQALETGIEDGKDHSNPAALRPQFRAGLEPALPLEVTFLLKEHCAGAHMRTMRLHDALEKHLPQCTMCSLSTFLTAAAVYAQINCRLSVM